MSFNLRKRSTYQTSFNTISLMKDDLNDEVLNGTPKTLIPFDGVLTWDEVSKLGGKLEKDHVTHF